MKKENAETKPEEKKPPLYCFSCLYFADGMCDMRGCAISSKNPIYEDFEENVME